jgi:ribonuclease BN (tRNA processing enzyme)
MVDAGVNCVRQADAAFQNGILALQPVRIKTLFITHLHTDHTLGYPDLILTPWDMGRATSLNVYGPAGTKSMTSSLLNAWKVDIQVRTSGLEGSSGTGYKPVVHEIKPGVVFKDQNVTVTAFKVLHGTFPNSFGFKFKTPDQTIVVSGDTKPCSEVVAQAKGANVLIHEVYSAGHYNRSNAEFKKYLRAFHTSSAELADIARKAGPKLLVLTHKLGYSGEPEGDIATEVRKGYRGRVIDAEDMDVIEDGDIRRPVRDSGGR